MPVFPSETAATEEGRELLGLGPTRRTNYVEDMSELRVASPPEKPLLIWDGDCHFCRHWIERWKTETAGCVDYETSQDVAACFPEIPREQFQKSVVLIEPDGRVYTAAEAVYRSLQCRSRWLQKAYERVPGFAAVSEFAYGVIAGHRTFASFFTRVLWGNDVRPPTYFWARRWFLRLLGLVFLIAFVSLWTQVDGLIGENGILPAAQFLHAAHDQLGGRAYTLLPTFCWFGASNVCLHWLCALGSVLSILLIVGVAPALTLFALVSLYVSLVAVGQTFLSFQWDILLIETGFLAIFIAPWRWLAIRGSGPPVSRVGLFLLKFLLFKLMVMSAVVKLTSGDDCWWNLTALDYHYWSQPLPTVFAWWTDQNPEWFKKFSVGFCLFVEIIVPLFLWAPRRLRLISAGLLIFLQIAIAITGNYCFFNLLTIALCLLLIDDQWIERASAAMHVEGGAPATPSSASSARTGLAGARPSIFRDQTRSSLIRRSLALITVIATVPVDVWLIYSTFKPMAEPPRPIAVLEEHLEPFRIVSGYGLFRVMTKDRMEIEVEGSADGIDWKPYVFKWKPDDVKRAPTWCAPHQPRLDWQMWFAALGTVRENRWFVNLAASLLENKTDVVSLFATNPFPSRAPKLVRARLYRYRFTTGAERAATGAWWKREELGEYLPEISLRGQGNEP
jgi:predicted DCC family thiol-disulfide oxidoreductase YuxK